MIVESLTFETCVITLVRFSPTRAFKFRKPGPKVAAAPGGAGGAGRAVPEYDQLYLPAGHAE